MHSKPRWYTCAALALAAIPLLLALYVGAYYATVRPEPWTYSTLYGEATDWYPVYAHFPCGDGAAFFAPVHGIDRRMRPEVWNPQPW